MWRERVSPVTATLARAADRGRHDRPRQDAHGRVRDGRLGHQHASGHAAEPVGPRRAPHAGRLVERLGRGGGRRAWRPVAIGTDTGGSVRLPAAWCGIVGLKVTAGRISTYGVLPLASTLDTPGPLARSVEDAALIFRVLNGPDPRDPADARVAARRSAARRCGAASAGSGSAVMPDAERAGVDAEVLAAYDAAVDALAQLGARDRRAGAAASLRRLRGGHRADHRRRGLSLRRPPRRRPSAADRPARAARASSSGAASRRATISLALAEREERPARVRRRARRRRRAADADDADGGDPDRPGRTSRAPPAHFTRPVNYLGLCALAVPERLHRRRACRLSLQIVCHAGRRGDGAAHRLGLRAGDRLEERRPPEA